MNALVHDTIVAYLVRKVYTTTVTTIMAYPARKARQNTTKGSVVGSFHLIQLAEMQNRLLTWGWLILTKSFIASCILPFVTTNTQPLISKYLIMANTLLQIDNTEPCLVFSFTGSNAKLQVAGKVCARQAQSTAAKAKTSLWPHLWGWLTFTSL